MLSLYEVTGPTSYRDHNPGAVFEATLEVPAEQRAIKRGAIKLLEESKPTLRTGSWTLPSKEK